MVEESTAASHGLAREAETLRVLLTRFRLPDQIQTTGAQETRQTGGALWRSA